MRPMPTHVKWRRWLPALLRDRNRRPIDELVSDEIVINTWTFYAAARRRSYELLAKAFGLVSMAGKTK
jgi:hypothetical protein